MSQAEVALDARDGAAALGWLVPLLARPELPADREAEAQWLRARALRMQGDSEGALQAAERALAKARMANDPALLAKLLQERALLAMSLSQVQVTVDDLSALEALGTELDELQWVFEARVASARLLVGRGGAARALARLTSLMFDATDREKREVDMRSAVLALIDIRLAEGEGALALKGYQSVLRIDPDYALAWLGCARSHLLLGDASAAGKALASARQGLPAFPSGLLRDLFAESLDEVAAQVGNAGAAGGGDDDSGLLAVRAAIDAGRLEDARKAAESAIMRDRNAPAPRAALAEVYLLQGEYDGAVNVFASMSGLAGDSRLANAGGTLAQALKGVEVYDVEGFGENWLLLSPGEKAMLRRAVQAARQRGSLAKTALSLVSIVEIGGAQPPVTLPEPRP